MATQNETQVQGEEENGRQSVTSLEFLKLYQKIHESGGNWDNFVVEYRKMTGSTAQDQSLKSACSNRISDIRKELVSRGVTQEKVYVVIPKFSRQTNRQQEMDDLVNYLGDELDLESADSAEPATV